MTQPPIKPVLTFPDNPIKRVGCILALIVWFLLLLLPCGLFTLATQGEISVSQGSLPGQQMRLWLIMEVDERGLGVSSTAARQDDANNACLQTSVSYLLWQGQSDPLVYCECFARDSADAAWTLVSTQTDACSSLQ